MKRVLSVLFLAWGLPLSADVPAADIAACRAAPTSACLADIGFALAQSSETLNTQVGVIDYLGQMRRLNEAEVLARRIAELDGHVGERAERIMGLRMAQYRIIEQFRAGATLEEVEAGPHGFIVMAALSSMAGIMQSGSYLKLEQPVDPQVRSVLRSVLAERKGTRLDRIVAADFLLNVGDEAAALAILRDLPVDTSTRTNLSQPMIRLLGPDRVWEIYQGMDRISQWWIADLATLSEDPDRRRSFLEEMYARAVDAEAPRERAFDLQWTIRTATELGHSDIAEAAMALQRAEIDPTGPEMRALVMSHQDFGTPREEMRAILRQAEKRLRSLEDETARGNALITLAAAYAEIGDGRHAAKLLKRGDADARSWAATVLREVDAETRATLLKHGQGHLDDEARVGFLARVAAGLARPEQADEDRDWARETAWKLLKVEPPSGTYEAGYFYDRLLNAALRLGLTDLRDAILERSVETALAQSEPAPILQAAYQYYRLFPEAAR